jgi:hypothetical protein
VTKILTLSHGSVTQGTDQTDTGEMKMVMIENRNDHNRTTFRGACLDGWMAGPEIGAWIVGLTGAADGIGESPLMAEAELS